MCVSRTSVSSILVSLAGVHEHMRFAQLSDVAEYKWTVQTTSGVSKLTLVHADYSPCTSGFNVAVAPDMGDGIIPLQSRVAAGLIFPGSVTDIYSISMFHFYFVPYLASLQKLLIGCCIA